MRLNKQEREIAADLGDGEALKQGRVYVCDGFTIGFVDEIDEMAAKGAIVIEKVGESHFAKLSPATRLALQGADHV